MSRALIDPRTGKPFASKKKDLSRLEFLVIHHAGPGTERWTPETFIRHRHDSALAWRKREHAAKRPGTLYAYSGNGYNAAIFPDGSWFLDVPLNEMAWSTGGLNSISLAMVFAGDFTKKLPPEPALKRGEQILVAWQREFQWRPKIIGHRDAIRYSKDATRTACPGDKLYPYLPTLIERVEGYRK